VCLCQRSVHSGHQFDFGVISLVVEDRGMTSEIDHPDSQIEPAMGTLFGDFRPVAYHPVVVWHTPALAASLGA